MLGGLKSPLKGADTAMRAVVVARRMGYDVRMTMRGYAEGDVDGRRRAASAIAGRPGVLDVLARYLTGFTYIHGARALVDAVDALPPRMPGTRAVAARHTMQGEGGDLWRVEGPASVEPPRRARGGKAARPGRQERAERALPRWNDYPGRKALR